jgi:hypothetical protein
MERPQLDLDARRPVWEALSAMFLDTDVALDRDWRAQNLAESPYSLEELDAILADEVYPVCKANLMCVAGVWSGFDPDWLQAAILRRLSRQRRFSSWLRFRCRVPLVADEWRETRLAIVARRQGETVETG